MSMSNIDLKIESKKTAKIPIEEPDWVQKRKTKPERHMELLKKLNDIYTKKNHDYGDSFHETFLEEGFAMARIRLSDKLNRFKTLSKNSSEYGLVEDESIRDTLMDLANYAIMTVLEIDEKAGVK